MISFLNLLMNILTNAHLWLTKIYEVHDCCQVRQFETTQVDQRVLVHVSHQDPIQFHENMIYDHNFFLSYKYGNSHFTIWSLTCERKGLQLKGWLYETQAGCHPRRPGSHRQSPSRSGAASRSRWPLIQTCSISESTSPPFFLTFLKIINLKLR